MAGPIGKASGKARAGDASGTFARPVHPLGAPGPPNREAACPLNPQQYRVIVQHFCLCGGRPKQGKQCKAGKSLLCLLLCLHRGSQEALIRSTGTLHMRVSERATLIELQELRRFCTLLHRGQNLGSSHPAGTSYGLGAFMIRIY